VIACSLLDSYNRNIYIYSIYLTSNSYLLTYLVSSPLVTSFKMLTTLILSALAWSHLTQAHGTITRVIGANGVVMPGLTSQYIPTKLGPGANVHSP
jgi:hypothetical protein